MKYIILYYPYEFEPKKNVGSGVRPFNILQAFKKHAKHNGEQLIFIKGTQKERRHQLQDIKRINPLDIKYVYIEFPNIPLLLSDRNHVPSSACVDYSFFKYLNKNSIPVGGFYRDIYWKFEEMYPLHGVKGFLMRSLNSINLEFIKKNMDILFLPSITMNKYVGAKEQEIYPLPSGGVPQREVLESNKKDFPFKAIYVGSLHKTANIKNLITAFENLNKKENKCYLNLICRKNEYEASFLSEESIDYEWLTIEHLSSNELEENYHNADFAIIPYKKNVYNDFAMPVKLFEYLSYGMPILTTNISEVKHVVLGNNLGVAASDTSSGLKKGTEEIINSIKRGSLNKQNNQTYFNQHHKWEHRVKKIEKVLKSVDVR